MPIRLEHVHRAVFPNNVIMERVGDEFVLRWGDMIWDWGLYAWNDRWVFDCEQTPGSKVKTDWFHGRYLVPAERIERDLDESGSLAGCPGGPCCMASGEDPPKLTPPSYFRQRRIT